MGAYIGGHNTASINQTDLRKSLNYSSFNLGKTNLNETDGQKKLN